MSIRVTGYTAEGHRITEDQGPARAYAVSRGGLTLGQALPTMPYPHKGDTKLYAAPVPNSKHNDVPRCGLAFHRPSPVKPSGICYRTVDHRGNHRSKEGMDAENLRRRSTVGGG